MSINAQAVIAGHFGIEAVCEMFKEIRGVSDVHANPRYRPEHWEIRLRDASDSQHLFDVFLNSWAAEDYADAWQGPSTLLTCRYQPAAAVLLKALVELRGGIMRSHETEEWAPSRFAKAADQR
jgi:hypothetical protein